ncbi:MULTISPECIES: Gfo/Idh/MocA family protein [unclassified Streptomyces]|uniref:Gfo/Idh/MocA family protein n=1 Tax=unclassified Streptomyces TaxID=2593676 RepID=UPI00093CB65B|nr:Gfo/Idh/MocA family oxidoreductase [Streptomyces sp. CB02058]
MRVGIIGAGNIGRVHARAVLASADDGVSLAGLFDVDQGRAGALAAELGTRAFASLGELHGATDGIVVASPNRTHAAYAGEALAHGRHVLCEKPMATSLAETAEMLRLSSGATGVSCVGFNYRYLPAVREIRRRIEEEEIGRVLHVAVALRRSSAVTRARFTWRDGPAERSTSGALGDLGVHLVDMLHFLFRSPVDTGSCRVGLQTRVATKEGHEVMVDDHAFVSGGLTDGPHFTLTASKSSAPDELGLAVTVTGSRGDLSYHSRDGQILLVRTGVDVEPVKLLGPARLPDPPGEVTGWGDSFLEQLQEWAGAASGTRPEVLAGFGDGHLAQRVLEDLLRRGERLG